MVNRLFAVLITISLLAGGTFAPSHAETALAESVTAPADVPDIIPGKLVVKYAPIVAAAGAQISTPPMPIDARAVESIEELNVQVLDVGQDEMAETYAELMRNPLVESVSFDYVIRPAYSPDDPFYTNGTQWGVSKIQASQAWDHSFGQGVIVAILDSGVDPNHPDLQDRLIPGYNFQDGNTNTADGCGHGTHVAGIAAATADNGQGIAGVAYGAQIMPVKVIADNCYGSTTRLMQGIIYAADNGARIISISSGTTYYTTSVHDAVVYARSKGVIVVAAAGNNNSSTPFYPASYDDAFAVAGTNSSDNRFSSSNYGSQIDLAAPATSIYSTYCTSAVGSTYTYMSGTSMAAPHVAGVAALILSAEPNLTVDRAGGPPQVNVR